MLRIQAFGELVVLKDGKRVSGVSRSARRQALLTTLACHAQGGISRARLAAILPPAESAGYGTVDEDLATLTETVGGGHLITTEDAVGLDASVTSSDVADFRNAIANGDLERAVQLYQGRLVDGFHFREVPEFERWLQMQRDSLASESAAALERLAEDATRRGEPMAAVRWWRMLAAQYPLNDRVAAALMEALVAAGDREGAVHHARFHEALVAERLDVPADATVLALAQTIRGSGNNRAWSPAAGGVALLEAPPQRSMTAIADPIAAFAAALADRYHVVREIGAGGYGLVLLARDVRHDRKVAIKLLRPELAATLSDDRFLREIRLISSLHHPNILPLFDSGTAAGMLYYVMPFVDGESLRQRLEREPQLPIDEALAITSQVAGALDAAGRSGIIHRDIKPENLLLSAGQVLVADFGIARTLESETDERLTDTGAAIGTPAYMSPEQADGEYPVDGRSDIYSLGCVLYEMLAGHPPFAGGSLRAVLARHARDDVPSLRTVRPTVSSQLEAVVNRSLAKVPADRYMTAGAFAEALVTAHRGRRGVHADRRASRHRTGAIATIILVLVLVVAAYVFGAASVLEPELFGPSTTTPHRDAEVRQ